MMIENNFEKKIHFLQINLGHRIVAHDALMAWLTMQQHEWVLCIQEPYFSNKGVTKIPRDYGAFWYEVSKGKRKRAMIIVPKRLQAYMITQHSNEDCIVIRIDSLHISVASVYCALDRQAEEFLDCVVKETTIKHRIICCMDANAYHTAWGSDLGKNLKWVGKTRGRDIMHIFDEIDIYICNEPPHSPTFIRDSKSDYSHIDVTACTGLVFNQIGDWKVGNETFGSDHVGITFTYTTTMGRDIAIHHTQLGTPWKKPSQKMR